MERRIHTWPSRFDIQSPRSTRSDHRATDHSAWVLTLPKFIRVVDGGVLNNWLCDRDPSEERTIVRSLVPKIPRREAGNVWCLPPVWNLRAVIWFHFAISSLVLLPSPLSVLFFSACWSILLNFSHKILQNVSLRDRLFLYGSCLAARRSKLVAGMCTMLPCGAGNCCYAFI